MSLLSQLFLSSFITPSTPPSPTFETFTYTGNVQTWTVPTGVTSVTVKMWGAGGGGGSWGKSGGGGGYATSTIPVTAGEVLNVIVGGAGLGTAARSGGSVQRLGGFGGGGNSGPNRGASGGGRSAIQRSVTTTDEFYSNVTLLLPFNGSNGSTTFTDYSLTYTPFTVFGNTQISSTQSKFGGSSAYFDGNGDYLSAPGGSQFAFGIGNFTIECWVYHTGGSDRTIIRHGLTSGTTAGSWELNIQGNNLLGFFWNYYTAGNWLISSGTAVPLSSWTHIAVVRNSNNLQLYINGVSSASGTVSFDLNYTAGNLYIGGAASQYLNGYIDDLRITKGVARYTANFTPPTAAFDTYQGADYFYNNVSLLIHADGTNGSTTFYDNSPAPNVMQITGNTQISTSIKKYGTGSVYFDGNGDALYTDNPLLTYFPNAGVVATIEFWMYPLSFGSPRSFLVGVWSENFGGLGWTIDINDSSSLFFSNDGSGQNPAISTAIQLNTWQHFAFVNTGSIINIYLNGVLVGTQANYSTNIGATNKFYIGCRVDNTLPFNGYMDDIRVTNGTARYTGNFTPPTAALPDQGYTDPYFSNVRLLLNMDGTNNSTVFNDRSLSNKIVKGFNNSKISTSTVKYGTGSAAFDGDRDYLTVGVVSDWTFLHNYTIPWTIEFWIKVTSLGGAATEPQILNTIGGSFISYISIALSSSRNVILTIKGSSGGDIANATSTSTIPDDGNWHFVTVTQNPSLPSNQFAIFIDGISSGTFTKINNFPSTLDPQSTLTIGAYQNISGFGNFNGFIDDLRITANVVRYTGNFTPTQAAFTNNAVPDLLTAGGGGGGGSSDQESGRSDSGGAGGGLTGQNSPASFAPGLGGTQTTGGAGGSGTVSGQTGLAYQGGYGNSYTSSPGGGGGGGGGYFGGGGGGDQATQAACGGGGGSAYAPSGATLTAGSEATPGNSSDTDRAGAGQGGVDAVNDGAGSDGTAGIIIIDWTPPPPTDPYYSNVSLLLHMDGSEGDSTFTNSGPTAVTVTRSSSNSSVTTTRSKFGGSSLKVLGNSGLSTNLTINTDQIFTAEAWVYLPAGESNSHLHGIFGNVGTGTALLGINTTELLYSQITGTYETGSQIPLDTWVHVAYEQTSSINYKLYLNGNLTLNSTFLNFVPRPKTVTITVGYLPEGWGAQTGREMYVDEARITVGINRYGGNFIPPTEPFPNN